MDKAFNILSTIVVLAIVTTIVTHGAGASQVIGTFFKGFSGSLNAGMGGTAGIK